MVRFITSLLLTLFFFLPGVVAQNGIQSGKIKTIDLEKMQLTLIVKEIERSFSLTEDIKVLGATGKTPKEKLQGFKEGMETFFKLEKRGGKDVLAALKLVEVSGQKAQPPFDTSKLKPLTEMGNEKYQGYPGGLYPDGKNHRPAAHEASGRALAKQVQPLDKEGKPSPDGKIVLLSLGMSNTSQASQGFLKVLKDFNQKNPRLMFVNGAQGGMTAAAIQDPDDGKTGTRYWTTVEERLKASGVTAKQVQAIWIKQADAGPTQGFPKYAQKLQAELTKIVQLLPGRFPNAKLVYLSSRTFGGFAKTPLNPEPYAFESGLSVKWLIERQLAGDADLNFDPKKGAVKAPWLSWGPYLWANGTTKRADGFFFVPEDFAKDGTHHSPTGQTKVGDLMLEFFRTDTTTQSWFLRED